MNKYFSLLFLPLLLLLSGCDEPATLFSGLDERQANPVLAALMENGLRATKVAGAEENQWKIVLADSKTFDQAVAICQERGLPKRVYAGVAEAFKKSGMVSSPSEERIRFMDALSQDLSRTISEVIDGVIDARVHVVLPDNDPFARNVLPSSAAVALRCRYDVDMQDVLPQIKNLVMNSIEGLNYDKISVTVFRDTPAIVVKSKVADTMEQMDVKDDRQLMRWVMAAFGALSVILIAVIVGGVLYIRKKTAEMNKAISEATSENNG